MLEHQHNLEKHTCFIYTTLIGTVIFIVHKYLPDTCRVSIKSQSTIEMSPNIHIPPAPDETISDLKQINNYNSTEIAIRFKSRKEKYLNQCSKYLPDIKNSSSSK